MVAINVDAWVPEEYGSDVLAQVAQRSAIEALARREPMGTDVKHVPRSGGMAVGVTAKSGVYTEDSSTNDEVILTARKVTGALRVAEEDMADAPEDIITRKQLDWATSYAKYLDNAALGVTAAENGTTIPFTSVYKSLRTSNAATGYTADANLVTSLTAVAVSYDDLSKVLGLVEDSDYWEDGEMVIIAHSTYRRKVRDIKDSQLRPIFVDGATGQGGPDTLLGLPVTWSRGAKTHATATRIPTGNPLLFIANRNYLILGVRSGPESQLADPNTGVGFLTDEVVGKMRSRRGFAIGHENAFAVLEDVA